ncbi:MAG: c-type cytochrome [Gemmatimonadota bacterium]
MRWIAMPLVFAVAVGCGPSEEEMAAEAAAAAAAEQDSLMAVVDSAYDPSVFDTLTWPTPTRRAEYGPLAYQSSCEKCHGTTGLGDGSWVVDGHSPPPPSFREPDWPLAGDLEGIRAAIFTGNREGMPHWGIVGLSYGAVDAVAQYIADGLPQG